MIFAADVMVVGMNVVEQTDIKVPFEPSYIQKLLLWHG